ncbi:hypothetical protein D3C76_1260580 [compost metagenome]
MGRIGRGSAAELHKGTLYTFRYNVCHNEPCPGCMQVAAQGMPDLAQSLDGNGNALKRSDPLMLQRGHNACIHPVGSHLGGEIILCPQ